MKRWESLRILTAVLAVILSLAGCQRYEPAPELGEKSMVGRQEEHDPGGGSGPEKSRDPEDGNGWEETDGLSAQNGWPGDNGQENDGQPGNADREIGIEAGNSESALAKAESEGIVIRTKPERTPVKVKGIYVSAYVAGMEDLMDEIIAQIDRTELNAVVIDVKDDHGRVTFAMDSPSAQAIGACVNYIPDMKTLAAKLKEHDIYMIARIPAFRDPYLAEARPDWCCMLADGSVFRDRNKLAWVNPYKKEVWNYLVEIGKMAGEAGFDEIQFDYIRFCTEKGMQNVVFFRRGYAGEIPAGNYSGICPICLRSAGCGGAVRFRRRFWRSDERGSRCPRGGAGLWGNGSFAGLYLPDDLPFALRGRLFWHSSSGYPALPDHSCRPEPVETNSGMGKRNGRAKENGRYGRR